MIIIVDANFLILMDSVVANGSSLASVKNAGASLFNFLVSATLRLCVILRTATN